jgi:hypothetical protein
MFSKIKVGDEVGLSTGDIYLPYKLIRVVDVYEAFISIGQPCDAGELFYKYSGKQAGPSKSSVHIVTAGKAIMENLIAQAMSESDNILSIKTALSYDFEVQVDRIKNKFYKEMLSTSHMESIIKDLSSIK